MRLAILASGCLVFAACANSTKIEWTDIPPTGPKAVVLSKGARTTYERATLGQRITATVEGPCEVRIYFRLALSPGQADKAVYGVEISLDGGPPKPKRYNATPDRDARLEEGRESVGDRDSTEVKIGAGVHKIAVAYVTGPPGPLLVMMRHGPRTRP